MGLPCARVGQGAARGSQQEVRSERLLLHAHPAPSGCGGHPVGLGAVHQARGPWQSCLQEGAGGGQPVLALEELLWESITFLVEDSATWALVMGLALPCLARHPPAAGCFPAVPFPPMCTMAVMGPCCRLPTPLFRGLLGLGRLVAPSCSWWGEASTPCAALPQVRCHTLCPHLLLLGVQNKPQKGPRPLAP